MLRNEDFTDRALLHIIAACAKQDPDDVASSDSIAAAPELPDNGRSRAVRVATRLTWMSRYGFIERAEQLRREYHYKLSRVTPIGHQLMGGRLTKSVESAIERSAPGVQLLMMRHLTRRSFGGSEAVVVAVRREYQHNLIGHANQILPTHQPTNLSRRFSREEALCNCRSPDVALSVLGVGGA